MKTKIRKVAIYHACRLAFNAGSGGMEWMLFIHALREGLGLKKEMTYKLRPVDFEKHPELREFMECLHKSQE